ncbi:MAG: protein phosphatase 2C domain-containing protein [Sediminibacterium sp.]|nr:protein phosphatase 2C domain-containing protein [Sediminibacterium sp.]
MSNNLKNINTLSVFAETDIGKERKINEDSVASVILNAKSFNKKFDCGILVVADGMGGHDYGELASEIASKKFIEEIIRSILLCSEKNEPINFSKILLDSVKVANNEVWKISKNHSNHIGTTLVGAIIINNKAFIVNIGDSRAYLVIPQKSINQITKDHSVVQEMIDANIITKEQAKIHPRRNIITNALGLSEQIVPDIFEIEINNQTLLLCSDGLHGIVNESEIINTVNGNIYKSAVDLIMLANMHGGIDNISVGLARV